MDINETTKFMKNKNYIFDLYLFTNKIKKEYLFNNSDLEIIFKKITKNYGMIFILIINLFSFIFFPENIFSNIENFSKIHLIEIIINALIIFSYILYVIFENKTKNFILNKKCPSSFKSKRIKILLKIKFFTYLTFIFMQEMTIVYYFISFNYILL